MNILIKLMSVVSLVLAPWFLMWVPRKGPGAVLPAPARVLPGSLPLAPAPRALAPWQAGRHWLLWAVLASGVAVLALMARGVWRGLKEDAATAKPAHDQASSTSADKA
jgi:hypothetical protein